MHAAINELRALDERQPLPHELFSQLEYAWGNEKYGASPEFLAAIVDAVRRTNGGILECGCGLSSLVLGVEAERKCLTVVSLEQDKHWAKRTRRALRRLGIETATVVFAPLRDYGDFVWYDAPAFPPPALVVCDGPSLVQGGRYGLLPVLYANLAPDTEILLDDATRDDERRVVSQWSREFGIAWHVEGSTKPFARISITRGAM